MKYTLLLAILFASLFTTGQTTDTVLSGKGYTSPYFLMERNNNVEYSRDTVKVILQVSDTSLAWQGATTTVYFVNPVGRAQQCHQNVYWIHAYAIRKITTYKKGSHYSGDYMWFQNEDSKWPSIESYLDDEYRPLPKSIVIWQSH